MILEKIFKLKVFSKIIIMTIPATINEQSKIIGIIILFPLKKQNKQTKIQATEINNAEREPVLTSKNKNKNAGIKNKYDNLFFLLTKEIAETNAYKK